VEEKLVEFYLIFKSVFMRRGKKRKKKKRKEKKRKVA